MKKEDWTDLWPTEPGYYWAYGDFTGAFAFKPKLYFVEVKRVSNGVAHISEGMFLWPTEIALIWHEKPVELPELPSWVTKNRERS